MNKNLSLLILIIAIVAGLLFVPQFRNYFKKFAVKETAETQVQTEMNGTIREVKNGSITVEGLIGMESKLIEFAITPETVLVNGSNIVTKKQIESGKNFKPQFVRKAGQVSDLVSGVMISKIQSKENLFTTDKATAIKIDYVTLVLPTK